MMITRRKLTAVIFALVAVLVVFYLLSHSRLQINITNPSSGGLSYSVIRDGKSTTKESQTSSESLFLRHGDYQIIIRQSGKNSFNQIHIGWLFKRIVLNVSLSDEKQRTYVGDNPAHCMYYTNALFTYDCGAAFNTINIHVPATRDTPTYVKRLAAPAPEGLVEGIIKTSEGNLVLVHAGDAEGPGMHTLYLLDNNLQALRQFPQSQLSPSKDYNLKPLNDGFLIYDNGFSSIYSYKASGSLPTLLDIIKPSERDLKPVSLTTSANHVTITYKNMADSSEGEVIDYSQGRNSSITVNGGGLVSAVSCGRDICVLNSKKIVSVYSSAGVRLYSIGSVNDFSMMGGKLLLAQDKDILVIDVSARAGSLDYDYGAYSYCGFRPIDSGSYLLCLSYRDKKIAMLINRSSNDNSAIDKKILQLQALPEITNLSINNSYIYISPILAPLVYDPSRHILAPDAVQQKNIDQKITAQIDRLGINRSIYQIDITK